MVTHFKDELRPCPKLERGARGVSGSTILARVVDDSATEVPIGTVGIIYESRPNVTSDAAVLCTKTGNATILRGGSESIHSNVAIAGALSRGGARAGLPAK